MLTRRISIRKVKNEIKQDREGKFKNILESVRNEMNNEQRRLNEINRKKVFQIGSQFYRLQKIVSTLTNNNSGTVSARLRYDWLNLPSICTYGAKFDLQHCTSLKKGGYNSSQRHT